ncbi:hypothetical protein OH687_17090 [Burkholderia anthina]|nr:hypothetical protein OH687_17090 [Burkholderia anthina]
MQRRRGADAILTGATLLHRIAPGEGGRARF